MEKFSQKELLEEGFLDTIRIAGQLAKKTGRGVAAAAEYANRLDREGFGVLKDPLSRFINSDPKAAFFELMKRNYSKTFDIKTVKILSITKDKNEATAATSATAAISGTPGTPATAGTPAGVILNPATGLPATPAVPALSGTAGTPNIPETPGMKAQKAKTVKGRTIITFTAKLLSTTGGSTANTELNSDKLIPYKAILSKNPEKDPKNMFNLRVFDDQNREIQGSKEYIPKFDKIIVNFISKYPSTKIKTDGTLTQDEAKKLIDTVYTTNSRVFNSAEESKFNTLLSPAVIKLDDIKAELINRQLVEKTNVSQKVLIEQLKSLSQ